MPPKFVDKDAADILGYQNGSRAINYHVDEEDKVDGVTIRDSIGRTQNPVCINESGLYSLILSSKLPTAKKFKHWVTSEVLPSIRKTGGYVDDSEAFISTYLPFADDQTKLLFRSTLEVIKSQNARIEADKPKVEFAEHVASDPHGIRVREFAKVCCDNGIKTGEKRLYKTLRESGYLDEDNRPYQQYIDRGYFKLKETYASAQKAVKFVTRITGKGQQYLLRKLKEKQCCMA
jgi:prophage antirepressor-like protein